MTSRVTCMACKGEGLESHGLEGVVESHGSKELYEFDVCNIVHTHGIQGPGSGCLHCREIPSGEVFQLRGSTGSLYYI